MYTIWLAVWCSGNALVSINAVALHRARLVLGSVGLTKTDRTTTQQTAQLEGDDNVHARLLDRIDDRTATLQKSFHARQERVIFTFRHSHREWPKQLCCSHGFSRHKSYVTCLRLPSTIQRWVNFNPRLRDGWDSRRQAGESSSDALPIRKLRMTSTIVLLIRL